MEGEKRRNAPLWLKLLVGFHIIATLSWSIPQSAPGVRNGSQSPQGPDGWVMYINDVYVKTSPIQQYVLSLGLWQSWDMFAPNPSAKDIWADAVVLRKDGTQTTFQYPRIYLETIPWKYVRERYRKYYERADQESNSYLWEPFAKRVAFLSNTDPANPPVQVILRRHYLIAPRAKPFGNYMGDLWAAVREGKLTSEVAFPTPPPESTESSFIVSPYFSYMVKPQDLSGDGQ